MLKRRLALLLVLALISLAGCSGNGDSSPLGPGEDSVQYPLHRDITATVFWVGEEPSEDNWFIGSLSSAWDNKWREHYGGLDDPDNRNGYFPAGFTPLENPFYFALPYNDFTADGERKANAPELVYWSGEQDWGERDSMCKNRWIKIIKGDKTCYAQWEDIGPFGADDSDYVFGEAWPRNTENESAGLNTSPAVLDFLGLSGRDPVDWQFVSFREVPEGPWKEIITTSQICWE
jgi:hypothetical protein